MDEIHKNLFPLINIFCLKLALIANVQFHLLLVQLSALLQRSLKLYIFPIFFHIFIYFFLFKTRKLKRLKTSKVKKIQRKLCLCVEAAYGYVLHG